MNRFLIAIILLLADLTWGLYAYATLVQTDNLSYVGAFRVPRGALGGASGAGVNTLGGGGRGLVYHPSNDSLIIGAQQERLAVEISTPTPSTSTTLASLPTASVIQVPGNVANSKYNYLNLDGSYTSNGGVIGSFLVYNNRLIGNAYAYYSGGTDGHLSHFASSLDWINGVNFTGMKRVGINPTSGTTYSNGGWTGGYMCLVPEEWRERIGWPALTGNGATTTIGRSSRGPSIWGFDPDDIQAGVSVSTILDAQIFVGYTASHPTVGDYTVEGGRLMYNYGTAVGAMTWPDGTDTIMVLQRTGLGADGDGTPGCYGPGTTNLSEAGRTAASVPNTCGGVEVEGTKTCCYDLAFSYIGGHAYPYKAVLAFYDANDLLAVKLGTKQYWEVVPYATTALDLHFATSKNDIGGIAYDPTSQQLFVSQLSSDTADQYNPYPIIHVFELNLNLNLNSNKTLRLSSGQARKASGTGRMQ